jgi:hypothetical protein
MTESAKLIRKIKGINQKLEDLKNKPSFFEINGSEIAIRNLLPLLYFKNTVKVKTRIDFLNLKLRKI